MTYTDIRVQELLNRNLWLKKSQKEDIIKGTEQAKREILPLLEEMDVKQVKLFRKVTAKNPNFFDKLTEMADKEAKRNGEPVGKVNLPDSHSQPRLVNEQGSRFMLTILEVFRSELSIPEGRELSGAEQQYLFSLFKQWVSKVPPEHPKYRDSDRMNADYETLGIITSKRRYNYAKLRKAVTFIAKHETDEPNFQRLCVHMQSG